MPIRSFVCVFAVALLTAPAVWSQEARGTIRGRITDQQEAAVAGATVQVTNVATGVVLTLKSNEQGVYQAPYLPLGQYTITAEAPASNARCAKTWSFG